MSLLPAIKFGRLLHGELRFIAFLGDAFPESLDKLDSLSKRKTPRRFYEIRTHV